jgi:hypothetical protein
LQESLYDAYAASLNYVDSAEDFKEQKYKTESIRKSQSTDYTNVNKSK